jgi:hypothetical protein
MHHIWRSYRTTGGSRERRIQLVSEVGRTEGTLHAEHQHDPARGILFSSRGALVRRVPPAYACSYSCVLFVPLGVFLCSIRSLVSFPRLVVRVQALRALRYMTVDPLFVRHVTASRTALLLARYTPPTNVYSALSFPCLPSCPDRWNERRRTRRSAFKPSGPCIV